MSLDVDRPRFGFLVEFALACWLHEQGKAVALMPPCHPYDLRVDGERVQVKAARPSNTRPAVTLWYFGHTELTHCPSYDMLWLVESTGERITGILRYHAAAFVPQKSTLYLSKAMRAEMEEVDIPLISPEGWMAAQGAALAYAAQTKSTGPA